MPKLSGNSPQWGANDFDLIKWLRYSPGTSNFLFCARPAGSTWRYLYEYSPNAGRSRGDETQTEVRRTNSEDRISQNLLTSAASRSVEEEKLSTLSSQLSTGPLRQLSHEDTYNGQYLQNGRGYVYVGNPNNQFYLAVRPENPAEHTNLFTHGSVVSYATSGDGMKIFIHGAIGDEPQGIWEYDLNTRKLRQVSNGMNKPFVASRIISPEEIKIKSFDGLDVPCFFFTPPAVTDEEKNAAVADSRYKALLRKLAPRTKYPAVIYIPPNSSQMQRSFGPRSQFLANIGFYFLAVNYRGVDGYGRDYASMYDPVNAAQDILAAYKWLIKNPNVDKKNIFIFSMSGGTPICAELLAVEPKLWRGMAIDKPSGMSIDPRFEPGDLPPLFFITGDQDPAMPSIQRFSDWAKANDVKLKTTIYTNAAHITFDLNSRKMSQKQVAEFYLENLK